MTNLADVLKIADTTSLKLPAGLYTSRDYLSGRSPFGVLYFYNNTFHLSVGGIIPNVKSKIVVY